MKTVRIALAGLMALALSTGLHLTASDDDNGRNNRKFRATLVGFDEVPSVSTPASGRLELTISNDASSINYTLTFSGITSAIQQSHIHFAQPAVNGGIVLWLCQGTIKPAATLNIPTPEDCPTEGGGTVTGTLTAADVVPTAATQQIAAGEFAEVIAGIRAGYAYANVHSGTSPGGEIRGQIRNHEGRDH